MKELTLTYLAMAVIAISGCTSTQTVSYPAAADMDLDGIPQDQKLLLYMVDGTQISVDHVVVEGDSLFLFEDASTITPTAVHRSEVGKVVQWDYDIKKTGLTSLALVGLVAACVAVVSLVYVCILNPDCDFDRSIQSHPRGSGPF